MYRKQEGGIGPYETHLGLGLANRRLPELASYLPTEAGTQGLYLQALAATN